MEEARNERSRARDMQRRSEQLRDAELEDEKTEVTPRHLLPDRNGDDS